MPHRSFTALLLLALASLGLTACGGSTPPPDTPSGDATTVEAKGGAAEAPEDGSEAGSPEEKEQAARGGGSKIEQCNALIEVINAGVNALGAKSKSGNPTDDLRQMAGTMDKVAEQASKVRVSLPDLAQFKAEYRGMATDVAKHARAMADAADAKDIPTMQRAQAALDRAVKREDPLVDAINQYCQGP
jgi:hypothetical protein